MEAIIKEQTRADQVYDCLRKNIQNMKTGENRLPSEDQLAERLGVSRATIREALKRLTHEGAISKIQGKGNFAHPSVFQFRNRIDLYPDFNQLLSHYGQVHLEVSLLGTQPSSKEFQQLFGEDISYTMAWTYLVWEKPLIWGLFEFPEKSLIKTPTAPEQVTGLPEFGQTFLGKKITYCAMELNCGFNQQAANCFGVFDDIPLQCWKERIYDLSDQCVGFCRFYLHPTQLAMTITAHFDL